MRRLILIFGVSLVLSVMLVGPAGALTLVFEAEHYTELEPVMQVGTGDSTGDAGAHLFVPFRADHGPDSRYPPQAGSATYRIRVPVEGDYCLWGLVWWLWDVGDGFSVTVDDQTPEQSVRLTTARHREWHWARGTVLHLTAGPHRLRFYGGLDGDKLDQFLLTSRAEDEFCPTRHMAETPQYLERPAE